MRARDYTASAEIDLMPWLLLAALLLALADTLIGLQLRGLLFQRRGAVGAAAAIGDPAPLVGADWSEPAQEEAIIAATADQAGVHAHRSGGGRRGQQEAGLEELTLVAPTLRRINAGEPRGVNLAVDDLNLFPLLYWPVRSGDADLAAGVAERLDAYLRQGGMILFDTGDAATLIPGQAAPGPGAEAPAPAARRAQSAAAVAVPEDHTLTRSFYLLQISRRPRAMLCGSTKASRA